MTARTVRVDADGWRAAIEDALDAGHGWLHSIGAVDDLGRSDTITVTARLVRFDEDGAAVSAVEVGCPVPRDGGVLPGVADLVAGADWHQREVHDFFGVRFEDADLSPLLNHDSSMRPLRKDFVLGSRAGVPWPGAKKPGEVAGAGAPSRRRMAPPGVPDPSVWGDRSLSDPPVAADELAAALAGGRVRRRR